MIDQSAVRTLARTLVTSAVLTAGLMLAGCNSDQMSLASNAKANKPVPGQLIAEMQKKDMDLQSPLLVRLFKQEAELEVWKQDRSGNFALLKTYPICRWSGDLGPKIREGDRQAPEGFYSITPGQMNPQSSFYLSFNMGYPNAFDKALGRTGSQLMVHGDCSSRGCYAMTDEQISDIYALGRESFFGGQRAFQVQAYPFRMTPVNMAKHRNNPNMPFWKMIKNGNDHFEVTKQEPKVEFCENRYVFDPAAPPNAMGQTVFNASAKCPIYSVPGEIADAVREKQRKDDIATADLITKGTPMAQRHPDIDGGMNHIFAAKLPNASTGLSDPETPGMQTSAYSRVPGTIPPHVNPPKAVFAAVAPVNNDEPMVAVVPGNGTLAPAATGTSSGAGFLGSLASRVGIGGSKPAATPAPAAVTAKPIPLPAAKSAGTTKPTTQVLRPSASIPQQRPAAPRQITNAKPAPKPTAGQPSASAAPATRLNGAAPVVSANSFDNRTQTIR